MKNLTFITGAVRSGKSLFAEKLAEKSGRRVFYMASMQILEADQEQVARVKMHRDRRPASWTTIDVPFDAHKAISILPAEESFVVFDCLSLYVTNILVGRADVENSETEPYSRDEEVQEKIELLIEAFTRRQDIDFALVSNEVGWGLVPETKLGRAFRDFLGMANQKLASKADNVYLCCSGLQLRLK